MGFGPEVRDALAHHERRDKGCGKAHEDAYVGARQTMRLHLSSA